MCFKTPEQSNNFTAYAGGVSALFNAFNSASAARGEQAAYGYEAKIAENNASSAERAAADALDRGATEASAVRKRGAQVKGQQRAVLAAGNVDQSFGSALDILTSTDVGTDVDAATAQENAGKEAYALRVQAANYRDEARIARYRRAATSPLLAGGTALLDGVTKVASRWYSGTKT